MKGKTLTLLLVAVGFGVVAAFVTWRLGQTPRQETVDILVARQDLRQGTFIKDMGDVNKHFKMKKVPKEVVPKAAMTDPNHLLGKTLNKSLSEDAHVTPNDITEDRGPRLEEGQVAYAIRVDQEKTAGGFVIPGRRVNVILVERRSNAPPQAKLLLEGLLVLAADALTAPPEGSKANIVPTTVTLAVTPKEAQMLAEAKELGQLSLALLPLGAGPPDKSKSGTAQTVRVIVAKKRVPQWHEVVKDDENFEIKEYPRELVPENALRDLQGLIGRKINRELPAMAVVTDDDIKSQAVADSKPTVILPPHRLVIVNGAKAESYWFEPDGQGGYRTPAGGPRNGASKEGAKPAPAPAPVPTPMPSEGI